MSYCTHKLLNTLFLIFLFILLISCGGSKKKFTGLDFYEQPKLHLNCESAILLDNFSGKILFEKNSKQIIPPASMTKLVTTYVALEGVKKGEWNIDKVKQITSIADYRNQPKGSSLMFLKTGNLVTLDQLLRGLAVSSGNDSAMAVILHTTGNSPEFIKRMNWVFLKLGLKNSLFVEPSGINPNNKTNAFEFALFCRDYIKKFPYALENYNSLLEFEYPKNGLIQYNHNELLGRCNGVDGLKSGYIDESGYNLALTAKRGETRLIAILMGGPGKTSKERSFLRAIDGARLLDWGFERFATKKIVFPEKLFIMIDTSDGQKKVLLKANKTELKSFYLNQISKYKYSYKLYSTRKLSYSHGKKVGEWNLWFDGKKISTQDIIIP